MSNASSFVEKLINSPLAAKAGVPQGYPLRRYKKGEPPLVGPIEWGGQRGRLVEDLKEALAGDYEFIAAEQQGKRSAMVFDATGLSKPEDLRELYDFFHPQLKNLNPCARLVVIGTDPATQEVFRADARIAARALEGFTRSLAKEMRKGGTVNLILAAQEATAQDVEAAARFFLSAKSAYVDAQVVRVSAGQAPSPQSGVSWEAPLAGKLAVVTGAARGIGATIAETLARDGAQVICVDVPAASEHLTATANKVKGSALPLDVTAADAAAVLGKHAQTLYGRPIDVLVHNAGITRDKLLVNMDSGQWDAVMAVNLFAPVRITEGLLEAGAVAPGASIIGVSSMAGISGNRGQTNYATTKAGIIGMVDSLSQLLAEQDITVNAVAPGFIETAMTAAMPTGPREIGRRINSLQQGGQPVDVAEAVAFFASPLAASVSGNTVRVCGQNMMGA